MKKHIFSAISIALFSFLLMFLLPGISFAESPTDEALQTVTKLRQHLDSLDNLSFQFSQRTSGQMSGRPRQASGKAFFQQMGDSAKMRWDYSAPDTQVIISDGTTLKMYFEKMNQMIIASADSLQQDVLYSFFAGNGNMEKDFLISTGHEEKSTPPQDYGYETIKMVPRAPTTQVKYIRLWITPGLQIKRLEIHDNFDTITLLSLTNIEENVTLINGTDQDIFDFTPPEGTEIIEQ